MNEIVARRRKDFTKEFFVHLFTVAQSYHDNSTKQNGEIEIFPFPTIRIRPSRSFRVLFLKKCKTWLLFFPFRPKNWQNLEKIVWLLYKPMILQWKAKKP